MRRASIAAVIAAAAISAAPRAARAQVSDNQTFWILLIDQAEYRRHGGANGLRWDVQGWVGKDYDKLWIKTEGLQDVASGGIGEGEVQALYSRLISPFWEFQAGVRYDARWSRAFGPSRAFAVLGFQGIAPYFFDLEPALFISQDGDLSARLTSTYDLLLTQRLILQGRFEVDAALQKVERFGVGSGLNDVELGARLRYELSREFAPYLGISWVRKVFDTSVLARRAGESDSVFSLVAGLRLWF